MIKEKVNVRYLGLQDYDQIWRAMQQFTNERTDQTHDEIWVIEHHPIFTQGQNGKAEHILNPGNIPVIKVDRGGQITYHGPGQLVIYPLVNIQRKGLNVRTIVTLLENCIIQLLNDLHIESHSKREAPGVYVKDKKIASIGLRIRRGATYHGLALNVKMDLEPFLRINPCGFPKLEMTQIADFCQLHDLSKISQQLINYLIENLGYTTHTIENEL